MSGADWLSMLGLARRAGAVVIGEEAAAEAALDHRARLILLAADTASGTAERALRLERERLPVLHTPADRKTLGGAVGYASVAVVAVCDLGFAAGICQRLAQTVPEAALVAGTLNDRQEKALRRKEDTARYGRKSGRRK